MSHQRQLFNKNQIFYYKRVMKGDEWRMCRRAHKIMGIVNCFYFLRIDRIFFINCVGVRKVHLLLTLLKFVYRSILLLCPARYFSLYLPVQRKHYERELYGEHEDRQSKSFEMRALLSRNCHSLICFK
jgi:hypothetical protein